MSNRGWSNSNHAYLGLWAEHIATLARAYRKTRRFWSRIGLTLFIATQICISISFLLQMLQVQTPFERCLIAQAEVCTTFYFLSLLTTCMSAALAGVKEYLSPDDRANQCTKVAAILETLSQDIHIQLQALVEDRAHFKEYCDLVLKQFEHAISTACPLAPGLKLSRTLPKQVADNMTVVSPSNEMEQYQTRMLHGLNRMSQTTTITAAQSLPVDPVNGLPLSSFVQGNTLEDSGTASRSPRVESSTSSQ